MINKFKKYDKKVERIAGDSKKDGRSSGDIDNSVMKSKVLHKKMGKERNIKF